MFLTLLQSLLGTTPWFRGKGRIAHATYSALGYRKGSELLGRFNVAGRSVRYHARIGSLIEESALYAGCYEPAASLVINSWVTPGSIAVDVGANVGLHTLRMACIARQVVAFEPNPEVRERLLRNLALNDLNNVIVRSEALDDHPSHSTLYLNSDASANRNATMIHDIGGDVVQVPLDVRCIRLDDVPFDGRVSFVKMDIEGYELAALRGATTFLKSHQPAVLLEYSPYYAGRLGYEFADVCALFASCGHYRHKIVSNGEFYIALFYIESHP
jgi:FkbM family methyltransferase